MKSLILLFTKFRYLAVACVFATINVLFGTWAIFIPHIKSALNINEAQLGFAIFFMALGTLTMLVLAPKIIRTIAVGKATAIGILICILSFLVPFAATHYYFLCFGMYLVGASTGFTDVSMNTLVSKIEIEDKVHIMSVNHGFFSIGGFIGAGLGGLFLSKNILPIYYLMIVIVILLTINIILIKKYINVISKENDRINFNIKNFKPLIVLAIIGFFVMASEGAIVDWSALYLQDISKIEVNKVGLGFTIFSLTMAIGRFFGDGISIRFGSRKILKAGLVIALIGFLAVLLIKPIIVLIGFGLIGLGLSIIVPELFRIGGKLEHVESSHGVSVISGSGFVGFLVGPVVLGYIANTFNLKMSFLLLLFFMVISIIFTFGIKSK